jgi:hypothetical protein
LAMVKNETFLSPSGNGHARMRELVFLLVGVV